MNKKYLFGMLIVIVIDGSYAGYKVVDNSNNGNHLIDTARVPINTSTMVFDSANSISVCSFNIQFLGHFKKRDNEA